MILNSQPANRKNIKPTCERVLRISSKHVAAPANRSFATYRAVLAVGLAFASTRKRPHGVNAGRLIGNQ
jgi:hypothetical protein